MPLARRRAEADPAYNSCGLGLMDDLGALAAEAEKLLAAGNFRAVKLRLGYPTLAATSPPCTRCASASATMCS